MEKYCSENPSQKMFRKKEKNNYNPVSLSQATIDSKELWK